MKKNIKCCIAILIICVMTLQLISCTTEHNNNEAKLVQTTVIAIEKYGHAVLDVTTADFIAAGYDLGDVVCISFENCEYIMPFYDGYYSNPGSLLLRGTNLKEHIAVCINYGDFSKANNVNVGDTAKITMSKKGGMRSIQELYSLQYSNNPNDFSDAETFANFRPITAGRIENGKLYRTSSPINNEIARADYADNFIESVGIATVLNLADSYADIEEYLVTTTSASVYYRYLYSTGKCLLLI